MISYEDVALAINWLSDAFGFREAGERFTDDEGRVTHAELQLDGATVMLGWPGPDYRSPKRHAEECEPAARWLATPWVIDGVHVEVGDLDAHYERARAAGASVLREPENLPFGRLYSAADIEGHRWMFMQPR
jgi:PhnB protein